MKLYLFVSLCICAPLAAMRQGLPAEASRVGREVKVQHAVQSEGTKQAVELMLVKQQLDQEQAWSERKKLIRAAVEAGIKPDALQYKETYHALGEAVLYEDTALIEYLLQKGADARAREIIFGKPILCGVTKPEIAELLLKKGAEVNAISKDDGQTPLFTARNSTQPAELIKIYKNYGVDPHVLDANGATPLHQLALVSDATSLEATQAYITLGVPLEVKPIAGKCKGITFEEALEGQINALKGSKKPEDRVHRKRCINMRGLVRKLREEAALQGLEDTPLPHALKLLVAAYYTL